MQTPRSTDIDDEIRSLYDALEERDRYITSLEQEIDRNFTSRSTELEVCKDELTQCRDSVSKLQVELKQLRGDNDTLVKVKLQLETQLKTSGNKHNTSEHTRLHQREIHRLELENQRLRASVIELEENEDVLVDEIDTLVSEKSKFQEQCEDLEAKLDSLSSEKDELSRILSDMKQGNKTLQSKLDASNDSLKQWKEKETATLHQISKLELELKNERSKAHHIELEAVKEEMQSLQASHDLSVADKDAAERDLDHAIQALHQAKSDEQEAIAAAVRKERELTVKANLAADGLKQRESELLQKCKDLEGRLEATKQQLAKAKEKNVLYEKGHQLEDAVRYQKSLELDLSRREFDIKQLEQKYKSKKEQCLVLTKACDVLKEKANLGPDFSFDDEEINNALKCEEHALKGLNDELLRQLLCLEGERNELLSQLRQRAVEIGEKGVKFLGMESDQVAQVIEFANKLRQGIVELPLNDRSSELQKQLSSIKAEREVDKVTITRLEREIFALSEGTLKDPVDDGEKKILMHALNELKTEMTALKGDGSLVLSPTVRSKAKKIIGEDLVPMTPAAEVQFMCLLKEYDSILERNAKEENFLNSTHLFDRSSDTPNEELFKQLLEASQENRKLKTKLNHFKATKTMSEKEIVGGDGECNIVHSSRDHESNEVDLEMKQLMTILESNLEALVGYSNDLAKLRRSVANASRLTAQITALQSVVEMKNSVIRNMKIKLACAKQEKRTLTSGLNLGREVDTSTSTNSLDRSIRREGEGVLSNSVSSLEDAAKLLFEKDRTIDSLRSKLFEAEKVQGDLLREADQMKADIQTLVANLEEAQGISCEIEVYKSSCVELQNAVDEGKKSVADLKEKLRKVSKEKKGALAKVEELKESLMKAKGALSVQMQQKSRSEHNLKISKETISSLEEQVKRLETQAASARDEKLKVNKKVRRLSSMLQSTSENEKKTDEEAVKSVGELKKRIGVQDKTIAGLASSNSKLRSELARVKMAAKGVDKEDECNQCKSLKSQVISLDRSLLKERKDLSSTQSKLERCRKKMKEQISELKVRLETHNATDANVAAEDLQAEVSALREKNESLLLAMKENNYDTLQLLRAENFQLKKENERLLKVDHLGLFEEIESLKYKYNEAVMQLNHLSLR